MEFDEAQTTALIEALGLEEGADAETVLLAVQDLVTTAPDPALAASAGGATIPIDIVKYEELKAAAAQGETLRLAAAKRDRESKIEKAIKEGRLAPSNAPKWRTLLEQSPEAATVLASMPKIVSVGRDELGHSDPGPDSHAGGDVVEPAPWIR